MVLVRYLQCQRVSDIACQTYVQTRIAQYIIDQRRSRRLAVRTRDTDHLCVRISCRKLDLRDDRRTLCLQFLNQRRRQRNTR